MSRCSKWKGGSEKREREIQNLNVRFSFDHLIMKTNYRRNPAGELSFCLFVKERHMSWLLNACW